MQKPVEDTTQLQLWLERHREGDVSAKDEIIARSCERLRILARKIMRGSFSRLSRWEQTDDVLQSAVIRLHRSLATVQPESVAGLLALGAQHIRWTLLDLINRHYGLQGDAANHDTGGNNSKDNEPLRNAASEEGEPESLEEWTAFHQSVEKLPEDERQVLSLVYYEGLNQAEVAKLLDITDRTVRRRLTSAKLTLASLLRGDRH